MTSQPPPTSRFESSAAQALAGSEAGTSRSLGKYRVLGALGQGGMAEVFLAVADGAEGFRKLCVVKLLKEELLDDVDFRTMFLDEARLAARLSHPNIVQTFEVDESEGRLLLAMEYVEGQPLTRVLRHATAEQLPLTAAVRVLCDVLEALDYAHALTDYDGKSLGVVHRDVTPHNVLVGYDGRVKLVDFGIAKSAAALQATQAGVVKGKVGYMAPEQATGSDLVDGRADIFSVGVMLWEIIAKARLTAGLSGREILLRRMAGGEPKIATVAPGVDPVLAAICDRAMAADSDDRFALAGDMQSALEKWLRTQQEPARKVWGSALRQAFDGERKQLHGLIEERLRDVGVSASLRRTVAGNATSSLGALTPDAASQIARLPSVPPSGTDSASISGRTLSLPPEPPRSWLGLAVGGSILITSVAALVYVMKMQDAPMPDAPAVRPAPASAAAGPVASAAPSASAAVPALESSTAWAPGDDLAPPPPRPHATGAGKRDLGRPVAAPTPKLPATPKTPSDSTPKPKASARALDEQDPYR